MCPLCNKPILWKKTDLDEYVPCDEEPVLYVCGGKKKLFKKRELIDGCEIYNPKKHSEKPEYALQPHFYTCPVLIEERREWAMNKRLGG